jgi:hypothetical protein
MQFTKRHLAFFLLIGCSSALGQTTITKSTAIQDGSDATKKATVSAGGKLLVTPDGVALPAHQSVNTDQWNGNTVSTNSGNKDAGTLRITIATDQVQLTNALKVDGSGVTQPVSGTVTANAGSGTFTNQQSNITADYDTGAGTQTMTMFGIALPASGGSVPGGTATNPFQVSLANTGANSNKLLVTPDSVALPAHQSTNVDQLNGTTADTNSGNKSAGTLRVVLATDQPALTNKLLVTPDSVALPAHQSTNVDQLNGTTADTNSGNKSAGTLRVVLATDQPALTNKLLVTPDSVALPAHQSTNVDQFNGTTADTNSGNKSAGTLRVVLATDQPTNTNALKVDGSGVTQPVSGTVTANAGSGTFATSQADPAVTSGSITAADAASTAPASLISGQNLITGTATSSSTVAATISGMASYSVQLTGTWIGTVQFEKSTDGGTTWASVGMTGVGTTTIVTSVTGTGANSNAILHGNAANLTNVRVRCTAYTSGTCTVKIQPSYGAFAVLATTNESQLNGTTIDTNSGTKSAGTQRVVLATDQPALTNKLLVTPDSVALPAHQSTNVDQLNGTTTDTNSGTKSAGTLRVVLATDQPALTNKLLVTPDSVALPANQSVNVNQLAGTTTDTNSGNKSAGTLRVVLATDQPALTNAQPVTPAATENQLGFTGGKQTNVSANFTRPADTTAYTSGDLVANSTTAASVVPLSFTAARINDATGMIRRVRLKKSTTTTTNAQFRVHFYQNDPSASTGITNGDNGAWLTKEAGYLGSVDVTIDKAFSDAAEGVGTPNNGSEINFIPKSGTQTIYALIEARAAYTPGNAEVFTVNLEVLQN